MGNFVRLLFIYKNTYHWHRQTFFGGCDIPRPRTIFLPVNGQPLPRRKGFPTQSLHGTLYEYQHYFKILDFL